eukprot:TRINITY_DN51909_c0_g1_i1.p1 TRINITY_DN51909_c0_g1~~TRINITY_DN51909_c0_g1_i1.p1  ORF type:complete len:176 (-),score=30.14 TRINITY_DN51909_c0_g1_i1:226-753(-)
MARELGVISDLQAAQVAVSTADLTLGFDATTQDGIHMNSIHFTTESDCFVIAIDQLAGGTAQDYESHICESVDHLAQVYSQFHDCDFQECRKNIIGNIANSMTDRAAVNQSTIQRVNASWGKSLNELNCHLHPLETITTECKNCHLHPLETITTECKTALNRLQTSKVKGSALWQ